MDGQAILNAVQVIAAIVAVLTAGYLGFAKWVDGQVKIAKENSVGAAAIAKIQEENIRRDIIVKGVESAQQALRDGEERRYQEVKSLRADVQKATERMERRSAASDKRVIQILENIQRRNPYRRGVAGSSYNTEAEDDFADERDENDIDRE